MKTKFHKIFSLALAVWMLCSLCIHGGTSADPFEGGGCTAKFTVLRAGREQPGMGGTGFDRNADPAAKDSAAEQSDAFPHRK